MAACPLWVAAGVGVGSEVSCGHQPPLSVPRAVAWRAVVVGVVVFVVVLAVVVRMPVRPRVPCHRRGFLVVVCQCVATGLGAVVVCLWRSIFQLCVQWCAGGLVGFPRWLAQCWSSSSVMVGSRGAPGGGGVTIAMWFWSWVGSPPSVQVLSGHSGCWVWCRCSSAQASSRVSWYWTVCCSNSLHGTERARPSVLFVGRRSALYVPGGGPHLLGPLAVSCGGLGSLAPCAVSWLGVEVVVVVEVGMGVTRVTVMVIVVSVAPVVAVAGTMGPVLGLVAWWWVPGA